jgi:hypothetical protein
MIYPCLPNTWLTSRSLFSYLLKGYFRRRVRSRRATHHFPSIDYVENISLYLSIDQQILERWKIIGCVGVVDRL